MSKTDDFFEQMVDQTPQWLRDNGLIDEDGNLTKDGCGYFAVPSGRLKDL